MPTGLASFQVVGDWLRALGLDETFHVLVREAGIDEKTLGATRGSVAQAAGMTEDKNTPVLHQLLGKAASSSATKLGPADAAPSLKSRPTCAVDTVSQQKAEDTQCELDVCEASMIVLEDTNHRPQLGDSPNCHDAAHCVTFDESHNPEIFFATCAGSISLRNRNVKVTACEQCTRDFLDITHLGPLRGSQPPLPFGCAVLLSFGLGVALCAWVFYRRLRSWPRENAERFEDSTQSRTRDLEVALSELTEKNRALEKQSTLDALTGVRNRAYFDRKLQAELNCSRRVKLPLALVILDIDHFKSINDTHGHLVGDDVIRGVAQRAAQQLKRTSDRICRYGGEEFALILPNTDVEGVVALAERIRHCIAAEPFDTEIGALPVRISAGCCAAIADSASVSTDFIREADRALYQAKEGGRNQIRLASTPSPAAKQAADAHE